MFRVERSSKLAQNGGYTSVDEWVIRETGSGKKLECTDVELAYRVADLLNNEAASRKMPRPTT